MRRLDGWRLANSHWSLSLACKKSETVRTLLRQYPAFDHADKQEALTYAMIAYLFASTPDALAGPDDSVPVTEGWIWVPKDVLIQHQYEAMGLLK